MPCVRALAAPELSVEGDAVVDADAGFGIESFHRAKRGSASALPDGAQVGYRYITGDAANAVLLVVDDAAVLYVPEPARECVGLDLSDDAQVSALLDMLDAIDEANANGGTPFSQLGIEPVVTGNATVETGGFVFRFGVQSEGRTYAAIERIGAGAGAEPSSGTGAAGASGAGAGEADEAAALSGVAAWFCDYGALASADDMGIVTSRTPFEELGLFLSRVDPSPLFVSIRTTLAATLIVAIVGTACGWLVRRLRSRTKSVIDTLFLIPMVLPPTACGLLLVWFFGKGSPTGQWLISVGVNLPFTWPAAVIAAVVVSLPFMYRSALGAFESIDPDMLDAARTLGWPERRVFARLAIPLAAPSLVAGIALSFARALGEFGATVFFAGNYAGITQTIPLAIYYDWMAGDEATALLWVVVVIVFSFAFMLLTRFLTRRSDRASSNNSK